MSPSNVRHDFYSIDEIRKLWNICNEYYAEHGEYPVYEFIDNIKGRKGKLDMNYILNMPLQNLDVFFTLGTKCAHCGLEGEYFALETNKIKKSKHGAYYKNHWHFNLYGVDKDGNEVLMIKDHIIPKSKGGKNTLDNYQPMCIVCNMDKADKM